MKTTFLMMSIGALTLAGCGDDEPNADRGLPPAVSAPAAATPSSTAVATEPATSAPRADEPPAQALPAQATSRAPGGETYIVQKGDTLYGIAESRDFSAEDLARWNDISDPRRLRIGQELRLTAP
jgi:LysM repeat protein